MDAIYPKTVAEPKPFVLTEEERKALKVGLVFAIEEGIQAEQDRALRAVDLAKFEDSRAWEIRCNLWQTFGLEKEVRSEVAKDVEALEVAYKDGVDDPDLLAEAIVCEAVDAKVFAQRFIDVKQGKPVVEPVLPSNLVVKPIEGGLEGEELGFK